MALMDPEMFKKLYEGCWDIPRTEFINQHDKVVLNTMKHRGKDGMAMIDEYSFPMQGLAKIQDAHIAKELKTIREQEKAAKRAVLKKKREDERKALAWDFEAASEEAINVDEIAKTLTRENPIAYVQVEQKVKKPRKPIKEVCFEPERDITGMPIPQPPPKKSIPPQPVLPPPKKRKKQPYVEMKAYVAIHHSIMDKALAIQAVQDTNLFSIEPLQCGNYVAELTTPKDMSLVLEWCQMVRTAKWKAQPVKVSVRYPKI